MFAQNANPGNPDVLTEDELREILRNLYALPAVIQERNALEEVLASLKQLQTRERFLFEERLAVEASKAQLAADRKALIEQERDFYKFAYDALKKKRFCWTRVWTFGLKGCTP